MPPYSGRVPALVWLRHGVSLADTARRAEAASLHRAVADGNRLCLAPRGIDVRLNLRIGERVRLARVARRGGEDHADDAAPQVNQRTAGIARLDVGFGNPDTAHDEVLAVDVPALGADLPIDDRGRYLLVSASGIADR